MNCFYCGRPIVFDRAFYEWFDQKDDSHCKEAPWVMGRRRFHSPKEYQW